MRLPPLAKVGIALIALNEVRGLLVVAAVLMGMFK
jgi:hypothetical protein